MILTSGTDVENGKYRVSVTGYREAGNDGGMAHAAALNLSAKSVPTWNTSLMSLHPAL